MVHFIVFKHCHAFLDCMVENILQKRNITVTTFLYKAEKGRAMKTYLDLKLVLVVGVTLTEMFELLSLKETRLKVLRRYKVLRNLDAVVNVANLEN